MSPNKKIQIITEVLPGKKLEIQSNLLTVGDTVEIEIRVRKKKLPQKISLVDFIETSRRKHPQKTSQEIEQQITKERDTWDN